MSEKLIKIILAILLFICLLDMPYGYYQLVRFLAFGGFLYMAYSAYNGNQGKMAIVFVLLAILFQPFLKIALGRELWNIVDVIVGVFLIVTLFRKQGSES